MRFSYWDLFTLRMRLQRLYKAEWNAHWLISSVVYPVSSRRCGVAELGCSKRFRRSSVLYCPTTNYAPRASGKTTRTTVRNRRVSASFRLARWNELRHHLSRIRFTTTTTSRISICSAACHCLQRTSPDLLVPSPPFPNLLSSVYLVLLLRNSTPSYTSMRSSLVCMLNSRRRARNTIAKSPSPSLDLHWSPLALWLVLRRPDLLLADACRFRISATLTYKLALQLLLLLNPELISLIVALSTSTNALVRRLHLVFPSTPPNNNVDLVLSLLSPV